MLIRPIAVPARLPRRAISRSRSAMTPLLPACLLWAFLLTSTHQDWPAEVARLQEAGELDRAVLLLEEHLEAAPDDTEAWRALARALELLVSEGGASWMVMDDAREAWDRALALDRLDVESLQAAADLNLRLGRYADAAALCNRALGTSLLNGGELADGLLALACRARIGVFQSGEHADLGAWSADLAATWRNVERARELAPADGEIVLVQAGFADALGLPDVALDLLADAADEMPLAASACENRFAVLERPGCVGTPWSG